MNINHLIWRNLRKNLKNYYLYVFALIFSSALYFSFVTLQYDPSMDETKGSVKGGAALGAASVLLVAIVAIFLLYANSIFIKRRSKEIGLFQLIGMTKQRIFRILSAENLMLYFGSLIVGILVGFTFSRLMLMILFKIIGIETETAMNFSSQALGQTLIIFCGIYLLIMLMNYLFIARQSILSLFRVRSSTEAKVSKLSFWEIVMGLLGITFIGAGYYVSSKLFGGDFVSMVQLFGAMLFILAAVIIGTYLFYKGSVSFISKMIRRSKGGYLGITDVLSLSSIMFRMKSSALMLTIITTVSALAIGLLSLSYISYYSAEKSAADSVPLDFALTKVGDADVLGKALADNGIGYTVKRVEVIHVPADIKAIQDGGASALISSGGNHIDLAVVGDKSDDKLDLAPDEAVFAGGNDLLQKFLPLKDSGSINLISAGQSIPLKYLGLRGEHVISSQYSIGTMPTLVVDQSLFDRMKTEAEEVFNYNGVQITDPAQLQQANDIFHRELYQMKGDPLSRQDLMHNQRLNMGLIMFIVGFLGLTFLITSGCILYFKQTGESEEEKDSYTILRKLGFTRGDLQKGIRVKQVFNFGIPLIVGLCHSYFAVQSGWFLFGTEVWTPMIIVMVLYTALYSIFGILSVQHYKKVIKQAL
ncbi:ABC transporter permease [Paenibacillus physcomitrellae]|uniref:Bacitracin export permease protein BceB n=1 Tax=Paenibacillus physcomitrellae TaxID=1619311 RepID=A0ABQ1FSX9_9BACL|nr:ABC transporter permease [Paenibacillus physcomitrellae]GGA28117.1 bacitracin export permease protein BceB [Paenibacillus physcomitrellae]